MLNKIQLIGRVGQDAELISFEDGSGLLKFSLATSITWKDKETGEKKEKTTWHNVVRSFRKRESAHKVKSYITKGKLLYVEGRQEHRAYEKDGQTKYFAEVICTEFKFLEFDNSESKPKENPYQAPQPSDKEHDDLPF